MKSIINTLFLLSTILLLTACQKDPFQTNYTECQGGFTSNPNHEMKTDIQAVVNKYITQGIPGIQVTVKSGDGWLYVTGGYAKIENNRALEKCDANWLFSITKTYTAALILLQMEIGEINLDEKIGAYLGNEVLKNIEGHEKISVRMLLNHTSGIDNVTELPVFKVGQLNNPLQQPSLMEKIKMMDRRPLLFEPLTDFFYSNTNYLLLQLILESVTGKSYSQLLKEQLFEPYHLENTWYQLPAWQVETMPFPNSYFDRFGNNQLENISRWNNALANASDGYGGIAATAVNVIGFYNQLGNILSTESLNEMRTWVKGKNSTEPEYGLGIECFQFAEGSTPQWGHEGDGIGSSTMILFIPDTNTYLYININAGRQLTGPYLFKITDFKNELCSLVAAWG